MKIIHMKLLLMGLMALPDSAFCGQSVQGTYVPFLDTAPTIRWADQLEFNGLAASSAKTLQPVPVGKLRFPGTKGGCWVMPYWGKGEYTFEAQLESGVSYFNQQILDWYEVSLPASEFLHIQSAGLYLTNQNCSTTVAHRYLRQWNGSEWIVKVPLPTVVDLPPGTIKLSHLTVLNDLVPYDDGGMFKDWGAIQIGNSRFNMGFVYGGYAPRLNGSTIGSWSDQGWDLSRPKTAGIRKSTVTWKIKIDSTNHNPDFQYFVQKDWGAAVSGELSANDWEWMGGNVAGMRIANFEAEGGNLTGTLAAPVQLMEGFKGTIPVEFSVLKK